MEDIELLERLPDLDPFDLSRSLRPVPPSQLDPGVRDLESHARKRLLTPGQLGEVVGHHTVLWLKRLCQARVGFRLEVKASELTGGNIGRIDTLLGEFIEFRHALAVGFNQRRALDVGEAVVFLEKRRAGSKHAAGDDRIPLLRWQDLPRLFFSSPSLRVVPFPQDPAPVDVSGYERDGLRKCDEGRDLILRSYDTNNKTGLQRGIALIQEGNSLLEKANSISNSKYDTRKYNQALKMARMKVLELK